MKSEIRQDIVSGDWIIVATERSKRPHEIEKRKKMEHPESGDPFEDPEKFGNEIVKTIQNKEGTDWAIKIIKNKYPLVAPGVCGDVIDHGPFRFRDGVGSHEVVIYRNPDKDLLDFNQEEMELVVTTYRDRYREILKGDQCQKFTLIFHNHGIEAGASLKHPHSQIISVPVYPPEVDRSLAGAEQYFKNNNKKVHQVIVEWEMQERKRTIYENDKFIAFCPYASKLPYEVRIYPKNFEACFDAVSDEDLKDAADALRNVLGKMKNGLNDPPLNFYFHTAPGDENFTCSANDFYTWHIEILPKLSILAGFELGTGIDVNVVDPESAAELLKNS